MRQASAGINSKFRSPLQAVMMLALAMTFTVAGATSSFAARHSAIVVDANTGRTLYASDANGRRYPASLTKMMTLYLTFEALAKGKISKSSKVTFSANAAAEPPTKLGVRKGGAISVDTAILSMVTKSANDSSTALGELLGGSEANFSRMMTAKARALGMKSTVFRNANGLPDPGQFTSAHDMAILGIALREHFPQYYDYFSQRSFMYGKRRINGHNRLLGRIKGVDGIKTGYTRASGFNLVSSAKDGGRSIVAVVMGGTSGASRDNEMAALIKTYMPKASPRGGGGDLIAKTKDSQTVVALVKSLLPKTDAPTPDSRPEREELASAPDNVKPLKENIPFKMAEQEAPREKAAAPVVAAAYAEAEQPVDPVNTASLPSGWAVQVASSPSKGEAKAILDKTSKQAPRLLADASAFTMPFKMDGVTYFRARFGGFDSKGAAWKACNGLKKQKIQCYAVQQ
ncbi:D-alanyl-D-alanine carboxypeptidase [Mesorhizobium sp. A556]